MNNQPQSAPGQPYAPQQPPYGQPQYVSPKSSTAAGLLGIFLGAFGAHNWYLGEKKKGAIHLALLGSGILCFIIAVVIVMAAAGSTSSYYLNSYYHATVTGLPAFLMAIFMFLGWAAMFGNSIWGIVEGIIILAQGDAGLARKGIPVNPPAYIPPAQYPAQPMPGQPYPAQPMPTQPYPTQPTPEQSAPTKTKSSNSKKKPAKS